VFGSEVWEMKKFSLLAVVTLAIVLTAVGSGQARIHGGHGFRGGRPVAPGFASGHPGAHFGGHRGFDGRRHFHPGFRSHVFIGVGPAFVWGPWWAYPYVPPPVVVEPAPPVYVQRAPAYWYYCPSAGAYYPNVQTCNQPWVPVPATSP
jgi:hypothetical protein